MTYIPKEVPKNDPPDNRLLEVVLEQPIGTKVVPSRYDPKVIPSRYDPKIVPSRYNPVEGKCDG